LRRIEFPVSARRQAFDGTDGVPALVRVVIALLLLQ